LLQTCAGESAAAVLSFMRERIKTI
jgi:hypothetical protein